MENGEAFDRPQKRRQRRFRRLKRCSRRRSERGTKADDIKPSEMNHVSTILVSDQFYNFQYLFKIIKRQRTYRNKRKRRSLGRISELFCQFPLYTWINIRCHLLFVIIISMKEFTACFLETKALSSCRWKPFFSKTSMAQESRFQQCFFVVKTLKT